MVVYATIAKIGHAKIGSRPPVKNILMTNRVDIIKQWLLDSPGDSFLQHALALEYMKAGDDVGARELLEHLLEHDPGYTGSYYHLAKLLERNGERQLAMTWYEKGIVQAAAKHETRALSELRSALDDLLENEQEG